MKVITSPYPKRCPVFYVISMLFLRFLQKLQPAEYQAKLHSQPPCWFSIFENQTLLVMNNCLWSYQPWKTSEVRDILNKFCSENPFYVLVYNLFTVSSPQIWNSCFPLYLWTTTWIVWYVIVITSIVVPKHTKPGKFH